jgi:hypothetical protein
MSKRLRSKRRSSPCIFQVVVLLLIRSFPPEFLVVFNSISVVKSIKFSTRTSKYFVYILQQLPSMRRTHVGTPTWINSISPELCPPLTCELACSGNEIVSEIAFTNTSEETRWYRSDPCVMHRKCGNSARFARNTIRKKNQRRLSTSSNVSCIKTSYFTHGRRISNERCQIPR